MTDPIIATLSTTDRPGVYRCQFESHAVEHKSPEGKLARRLLAAGYDAGRPFWTKWGGGPVSLKWQSLSAVAGGDVNESDRDGLHWRKWNPYPEGIRA